MVTKTDGIALVNQNLDEWHQRLCDWCLPTTNYWNGPYILVNETICADIDSVVTEVLPAELLRETFSRTGKRKVFARVGGSKSPNDYWWDMGWRPDGKIIVPDKLRWGDLVGWCNRQSDFAQTNFIPIATAPEEQIYAYLERSFASMGRR